MGLEFTTRGFQPRLPANRFSGRRCGLAVVAEADGSIRTRHITNRFLNASECFSGKSRGRYGLMTTNHSFEDTVSTEENWVLGLTSEFNQPQIFMYPAFERTLVMLSNLVEGHDVLHIVAGEKGSGKIVLLDQFLKQSGKPYSRCRVTVSENRKNGRHIPIASTDRSAYVLRIHEAPVVLLDDAHTLTSDQLDYLVRASEGAAHRGRIRSLVLFGMPDLNRDIQRCLPAKAKTDVINTLYIPPLSEAETEAYLHFRFDDPGHGLPTESPVPVAPHLSSKWAPMRYPNPCHGWICLIPPSKASPDGSYRVFHLTLGAGVDKVAPSVYTPNPIPVASPFGSGDS